jgi:hypothetical protein
MTEPGGRIVVFALGLREGDVKRMVCRSSHAVACRAPTAPWHTNHNPFPRGIVPAQDEGVSPFRPVLIDRTGNGVASEPPARFSGSAGRVSDSVQTWPAARGGKPITGVFSRPRAAASAPRAAGTVDASSVFHHVSWSHPLTAPRAAGFISRSFVPRHEEADCKTLTRTPASFISASSCRNRLEVDIMVLKFTEDGHEDLDR